MTAVVVLRKCTLYTGSNTLAATVVTRMLDTAGLSLASCSA